MAFVNRYISIWIIFDDLINGCDSSVSTANNNNFFVRDIAILSLCRILRVDNNYGKYTLVYRGMKV